TVCMPFSSSSRKRPTWTRRRPTNSGRTSRASFARSSGRCWSSFSSSDHARARVSADRIGELGGRVDFPEREVGGLADLQRAVCRLHTKGACAVDSEAGKRFFRREVKQGAGHVHREKRRAERRRAW